MLSRCELLPLGVRQEFFAGRMSAAQAPSYEAAAKRAGDNVEMAVFPDAGHFVFIDPQSEMWSRVIKSVRSLLGLLE